MDSLEELNNDLLVVDRCVPQLKEKRREYLSTLRDVLDVYLLSAMEEENAIYSLLSQRSQYHHRLKTISPFQLQYQILMELPFLQADVQIESGEPGFVKLKLPSVEDGVMKSIVWTKACHRGVQQSLIRHINLWKDDSNYLKQTAVLSWLADLVDKSLDLVGIIPNYKIQRLLLKNKLVLHLEDLTKNMKFTIELLPVIVFRSTQLPDQLAKNPVVFQNPTCNWSVECRSNLASIDQFWGISLWQHEKLMIGREHTNMKSVIRIMKALRDGCQWVILTNYHIRTLVLQAHLQDSMMFEVFSLADILLQLLLRLRDNLVSREGLPSIWDSNYNLFGGLNGLQKSGLARAVTRVRDNLQNLSENYREHFRFEAYINSPASRPLPADTLLSDMSQSTSQTFDPPPQPNTPAENVAPPAAPEDQPQIRTHEHQQPLQNGTPPPAEPPRRRTPTSPERSGRLGPAAPQGVPQGGIVQAQSRSSWWQNIATVAAGVGAVAVAAGAAYAMVASKNRNKK